MPKTKKIKDFEKQKLKVGKKKPERSNATSTSFQTKTLVLPSQNKGPGLTTYLTLTRHHQANTRRQALANVGEVFHLHEQASGEILRSVCPLMVDADHQVRVGLLQFMQRIPAPALSPYITLVAVHIHAAMTHITPAIRADSTRFLDVVLSKCPEEFVRQCFVKTLSLYFPLMGWPFEGSTQAGSVSTMLSLGKLAPKARAGHLNSLSKLLNRGLKQDSVDLSLLYHPDTSKFMISPVGNPFDTEVTDDVVAREEALENFKAPLTRGLSNACKEGGDSGRLASKILVQIS